MPDVTKTNQIWRPYIQDAPKTDSSKTHMIPPPSSQLGGSVKNPGNHEYLNFTRSLLMRRQQYEAQAYVLRMNTWSTFPFPVHSNQHVPSPWTPVRAVDGHTLPGVAPPMYVHSPWESPLPYYPSVCCLPDVKPAEGRRFSADSVSHKSSRSSVASPSGSSSSSNISHVAESNATSRSDDSDSEIIVIDDVDKCKYCNKVLSSSSSAHEKRCKVKHEGKYRCSICQKTYSQSHTLKQHMNSHMGLKPYKCGYCVQSFTDVSTRNKHQRVHTGHKPYHCPECHRGFTQSGNLYRHIDKIHSEAVTFLYRMGKKNKISKKMTS